MAYIQGKAVKEAPKQVPANPRLYNMITVQAKTRFAKYPSPSAAHWVHAKYLQMGGRFVNSEKEVDPKMRDTVHDQQEAKEKAQKAKVVKPVGRGLIKGESVKK
jgi:hypothetical protein